MDPQIESKAIMLASQNYAIEILTDMTQEDGQWYLAVNPELKGCMAQGSSIEEAIESLADARFDYIVSLLQDGLEVPSPSFIMEYNSTTDCFPENNNIELIQETIKFEGAKIKKYEINSGQLISVVHPC